MPPLPGWLDLPNPVALARDVTLAAADVGRRLLTGEETIRVAVTGLSRAGKTVFLTSLVANLLAAGAGRRTLPALTEAPDGTTRRLRAIRVLPAGAEAIPRFLPGPHLAALAAEPPVWPGRTADLSTVALTFVLDRASPIWGRVLPPRQVTLELLDYPGEWLLDLPLLRQTYAEWSTTTLARLDRCGGTAASARFLELAHGLGAGTVADDAITAHGFELYRAALLSLREERGLRFLQPGRFVLPGPRGVAPMMWFFPCRAPAGSPLGELLARRFNAYVADQRATFFDPWFLRFDRQVVLVDVLGALHAGEAVYEDTRAALEAIAGAVRYGGGWLDRLTGATSRVVFGATKADHVPPRQRDALAAQLGVLVGATQSRAGAAASGVHPVAAILCTEPATLDVGDRRVAAVRGRRLADGKLVTVFPGEVPLRPPGPEFWGESFFAMPEFRPPLLPDPAGEGVPHLGLDTLLADLLGDRL